MAARLERDLAALSSRRRTHRSLGPQGAQRARSPLPPPRRLAAGPTRWLEAPRQPTPFPLPALNWGDVASLVTTPESTPPAPSPLPAPAAGAAVATVDLDSLIDRTITDFETWRTGFNEDELGAGLPDLPSPPDSPRVAPDAPIALDALAPATSPVAIEQPRDASPFDHMSLVGAERERITSPSVSTFSRDTLPVVSDRDSDSSVPSFSRFSLPAPSSAHRPLWLWLADLTPKQYNRAREVPTRLGFLRPVNRADLSPDHHPDFESPPILNPPATDHRVQSILSRGVPTFIPPSARDHQQVTFSSRINCEIIENLSRVGIIEEGQHIRSTYPLFALPKPDGRVRVIYDLHDLTPHIQIPDCRLSSANSDLDTASSVFSSMSFA